MGLPNVGWLKSSILSALFKGICRVVANRLIGQQFSELWHYKDCTHKENGTVNMEYTVILDISTIALNRVGYLGSAPPHLFLTCPGRVSVPTTVPTHVPFQRNINCHSNQERILWKNLIVCSDILALTKVIQLLS